VRRRRAGILAAGLLALGGCGHAATRSACGDRAPAALARVAGLSAASVTTRSFVGTQAMPQCDLRAHPRRGAPITAAATTDTAPQAYFRLERTAIEASQQFSHAPLALPVQVAGIGLDADWFPTTHQLMTTDGDRLISVAVSWPAASPAREIALATAVARPFLGPLRPSAAG
jgi:hypothetical protein